MLQGSLGDFLPSILTGPPFGALCQAPPRWRPTCHVNLSQVLEGSRGDVIGVFFFEVAQLDVAGSVECSRGFPFQL